MKKLLTLTIIFVVGLFVQSASAQTKKFLVFRQKVAIVSSSLRGGEAKTYYFKVKKNTDMEIFIDEAEPQTKFTLYKPNGKLFYDDSSVNRGDASDLMDVLEDAGIYKIVVQMPQNLRNESKPIKFTLRLVLR